MAIHLNPEHRGRFHEDTGIPMGQPIPMSAVLKKRHSKSAAVRKRANFALMAKRGWSPLHKKD